MSAFVVSPETLDFVLSVLANAGVVSDDPLALEVLGQQLLAMNVDAVNVRYTERQPVPAYEYHRLEVGPSQWYAGYKNLKCLRYQCEEGAIPTRPLFKLLSRLIAELGRKIADYYGIDGERRRFLEGDTDGFDWHVILAISEGLDKKFLGGRTGWCEV